MHIGLDRKSRRGQETAQRNDIVAIKAEPVRQFEPARDAALALAFAVVIDEAAAPFAAQRRIIATRDQAGVFERNHRLVIVAIERPGLHLALGALSAVQELVKRMQLVIAPCADIAQLRFEFVSGEKLHSTISIPSSATS